MMGTSAARGSCSGKFLSRRSRACGHVGKPRACPSGCRQAAGAAGFIDEPRCLPKAAKPPAPAAWPWARPAAQLRRPDLPGLFGQRLHQHRPGGPARRAQSQSLEEGNPRWISRFSVKNGERVIGATLSASPPTPG